MMLMFMLRDDDVIHVMLLYACGGSVRPRMATVPPLMHCALRRLRVTPVPTERWLRLHTCSYYWVSVTPLTYFDYDDYYFARLAKKDDEILYEGSENDCDIERDREMEREKERAEGCWCTGISLRIS